MSLGHDLDRRLDRVRCEMGVQRCDVWGYGKKRRRVVVNNEAVQRVVYGGEEAGVQGGGDGVDQRWMDLEPRWDLRVGEAEVVRGEGDDDG